MRIADRLASNLVDLGVDQVFMVNGGGSMHLNDALSRNNKLKIEYMHHEQSCAMAAEGYARVTGKPAVVCVTSGPGGINAINGVFGSWTDSIPLIVISGQVKRETINRKNSKLRQLGDQENDIISMVKKITKFSYQINNPAYLDNITNYAYNIATLGRPGPVWIDVPIDIQNAKYTKDDQLESFSFKNPKIGQKKDLDLLIKKLESSKKPIIILGSGVRVSNTQKELLNFLELSDIPVVTSFNGIDLIDENNVNYVGRQGTIGDRAGNINVHKSDLILAIGTRLNVRQTGYNFKSFAKDAYLVMVDIDKEEFKKRTIKPDLKIHYDLKYFFKDLLDKQNNFKNLSHQQHLKNSKEIYNKYQAKKENFLDTQKINPYKFIISLFANLKNNEIVVTSDGTACIATFQVANIKKGQRLFSNSGSASMGYGLPASIGASCATNKQIICIEGDGSIQMNLQDLASASKSNKNLKIFVINNGGYLSIKQTQENYFPDNISGTGPKNGLNFPNFEKISAAYNLKYKKLVSKNTIDRDIKSILRIKGPMLCEIMVSDKQGFQPKPSSRILENGKMVSNQLFDMFPFLSDEELEAINLN
ncbi:MAG: hypothetical protein CMC23_05355 [Flavobacteriaceae bacterium]|nr:hypothetical protein [Flavobacteriaceae bacterium]|tara:strand:- start:11022 stop:12791 length:1770 start_codon:yes stop_codon:yes gene_type:complete